MLRRYLPSILMVENISHCSKWMLGVACLIIALGIIFIFDRFVLDSPEREIKRWEHEVSISFPAEASAEEAAAWLSSRGMTPKVFRGDDGRVISVHSDLHRSYILYWDGEVEFHFSIGKTGKVSSHSVQWSHLGP